MLKFQGFAWRRRGDLKPIFSYTYVYAYTLVSQQFQGVEALQNLVILVAERMPNLATFGSSEKFCQIPAKQKKVHEG